MKTKLTNFIIALVIFVFSAGLAFGQTSPDSDYRYQVDQYRRYYAEYQNYKKDYDARPSLENEQKALLSARQTILARELAWANFYLIMVELLREPGVEYPVVSQAIAEMNRLSVYHFNQASLAEKIATRSDLTSYTVSEMKILPSHDLPLTKAQVAIKIAKLIKLQLNAKFAFDSLVPKLAPVKEEASVINGLAQIENYSAELNRQIETLAQKTSELSAEMSLTRYNDETGASLIEIRNLLRRLMDVIIDLDTNYVTH